MRVLGGRGAIAALALGLAVALAACGHAGSTPVPASSGPVPLATPVPSGAPVPPLDRTERFVAPGRPAVPGSGTVA